MVTFLVSRDLEGAQRRALAAPGHMGSAAEGIARAYGRSLLLYSGVDLPASRASMMDTFESK